MKARALLASLAAIAMLATACGASPAETENPGMIVSTAPAGDESQPTRELSENRSAARDEENITETGSFTTLESICGSRKLETVAASADTIYQIMQDEDLNLLLSAAPKGGGAQRVLCDAAGCTHDNSGCPAWYGNNAQSHLFYINGSLLVMVEDEGKVHITSVNPGGDGRQSLASLPASQLAYDFVAVRGDSLYFVLYEGNTSAVTRLDLRSGENGVFMQLSSGQSCIGTSGDRLAVLSPGADDQYQLSLVGEDGEEEPVLFFDPRTAEYAYFDESFYLLQYGTGAITKTDLASGVETALANVDALPAPNEHGMAGGNYRFVAQIEETLVVDVTEYGADAASDVTTRWLLDINGQREPTASVLTTGHSGAFSYDEALCVYYDTGDALLVVPRVTHGTQTLTGTGGESYTAPSDTREWALISHSDFLAGQPVYTGVSLAW